MEKAQRIMMEAFGQYDRALRARLAHAFLKETFGKGLKATHRAEVVSECCYPMSDEVVRQYDSRLRRARKE